MHLVGLLKVRSHFCQQLVGRYADIDGESEFSAYLVLNLKGAIHRRRKAGRNLRKVHIALIHAYLLDVVCIGS